MSRWDIFRWRTLAGGPPCRQGRQRFPHRAFLSNRPKRVPPFGISDGGGTRVCAGRWRVGPLSRLAATASRLPPRVLSASGRRPAPTDAAAETGRWATSPPGLVAAPKGEPSLASPFGGRWCPVGTVQRLTEPAGESGLALARTERASCQPPHPLPWLSPLRARPPRSLVSFQAGAH